MLVNYQNLDLFSFNNLAKEWDLDFTQLEPGALSADLTQFICGECQLGSAKFNTGIKQEGVSPKGVWTFAFVNEVEVFWRNYRVQPQSIIIYAPGSNINAVSAANFEVFTFSIAEYKLTEIAKKLHLEDVIESIKSIDIISNQADPWNRLRKSLQTRLDYQKKNPTSEIDQGFIESFSKNLLLSLKEGEVSKDMVSTKKRLKLLQDVMHYMQQNIGEQISIVDIANHFNISERTLLYAFKNRFKIGPKAYFRILKLNHVHHVLQRSSENDGISTIARASGFWHMGQFYKDYKKFFGELPSSTLKKKH